MALVKFIADVSPYCAGDVVDLDKDEQKRVDALVEERSLAQAYESVKSEKKSDK